MSSSAKDPRRRFDGLAERYAAWRPSYPDAMLDWVLEPLAGRGTLEAADLGAGTGIFTRLLAARGVSVVGIEPSASMIEEARRAGGARYQVGEAAATGLPSDAFDLVTAAQAFHWFDRERALAEARRILRADGWCAVIFNVRARTPFLEDYEALLTATSAAYRALPHPEPTLAALRATPGLLRLDELRLRHKQRLDREGTFGRAGSSSYVRHDLDDRARFERTLAELFEAHQQDGAIDWDYDSVGLRFQFAR